MGTDPSEFYPIIKEKWKKSTKIDDENEATSIAGFYVKFPSKVPDNYNLQLGVVLTLPDNVKNVLLYYSKNSVTDSMKLNEFFSQKGIFVYYREWISDPQKAGSFESHIPDYLRLLKKDGFDAIEVIINEYRGIATNQRERLFHGYDIHDPSQVEFVMGNTHITIQGYFPRDDLLTIAKSIR